MKRTVTLPATFCLVLCGTLVADEPKLKDYRDTVEKQIKKLSENEQKYIATLVKFDGKLPLVGKEIGDIGIQAYGKQRIVQIIDDHNILMGDYWVTGLPTKGLIDDSYISLDSAFIRVEPKRYTTTSGASRTIPQVKAIDTSKADPLYEYLRILEKSRDWTDSDGKLLATARFVVQYKGNVILRRLNNGKRLEVPFPDLSDDDKEWVKAELRRQREEKRKEAEKLQKMRTKLNRR